MKAQGPFTPTRIVLKLEDQGTQLEGVLHEEGVYTLTVAGSVGLAMQDHELRALAGLCQHLLRAGNRPWLKDKI